VELPDYRRGRLTAHSRRSGEGLLVIQITIQQIRISWLDITRNRNIAFGYSCSVKFSLPNSVEQGIEPKGKPEEPAWNFQVETGEPVLRGSLIKTKLATIEVVTPEQPWSCEATFNISSRDVKITGGEGAWLKDLIPEKGRC